MSIISLLGRAALSFVYALIVAVSVDLIYSFFSYPFYLKYFILIFLFVFVVLFLFKPICRKFWIFIVSELLVALLIVGSMYTFYRTGTYESVADDKAALYSNKNVLLLVPHQDDEILVAGGVIEEYLKYGSEVKLAFTTNGVTSGRIDTRLLEALKVAVALNLPEENVYFLGYGDLCVADLHLYNSRGDLVISDIIGLTSTQGLDSHPAYREGQSFTRDNLRSDIKSLLLELKPDNIFCVEVETHPDHSALSLLLDEAMAEISREFPDYNPLIFKSSCYASTLYAPFDFYSENLLSTQDISQWEYYSGAYPWEQRIRFPLNPSGLSRSIYGCDDYQNLRIHASQKLFANAESIVNSDRVFWLRDSSSLCYAAKVSASSGKGEYLNDFKLFDSDNVNVLPLNLSTNTWVPNAEDTEKTALVQLEEATFIQRICLYDDPDMQKNILNTLITFDDGSSIETGPLLNNGRTTVEVNKPNVKWFSVKLLETSGVDCGISEIEAFSSQLDYGLSFVKLQNLAGDFVYDYYIDRSGSENFTVYSSGAGTEFSVSVDNKKCSAIFQDEHITIACPKYQRCIVTVTSEDGSLSDSVVISNPGAFMRTIGPWLESRMRQYNTYHLKLCNSYVYLRNPSKILKAIL